MASKADKKTLVSGIKPTGKIHLGNYLGAMKQLVDLQDKYRSFVFIADLHALTSVQNGEELDKLSYEVLLDYLAVGIDPEKTTIFKQSQIPQVAELGWIFSCITTMPYLMRAHAFKDAEAKNKDINVGTFTYPLLMSADILIHDADIVPVGFDQKQHIEYARDTAEKFNRIFGETFKLPEAFILDDVKTVPGTDGRKMSKSYNNAISLFAEDEEIKKAVMSIPTDSKGIEEPKNPDEDNIFSLLKFFADENILNDVKKRYEEGGIGYKEAKEVLIENLIKFISPLRKKRKELEGRKDYIQNILKDGGDKARENAEKKTREVRESVGIS